VACGVCLGAETSSPLSAEVRAIFLRRRRISVRLGVGSEPSALGDRGGGAGGMAEVVFVVIVCEGCDGAAAVVVVGVAIAVAVGPSSSSTGLRRNFRDLELVVEVNEGNSAVARMAGAIWEVVADAASTSIVAVLLTCLFVCRWKFFGGIGKVALGGEC